MRAPRFCEMILQNYSRAGVFCHGGGRLSEQDVTKREQQLPVCLILPEHPEQREQEKCLTVHAPETVGEISEEP